MKNPKIHIYQNYYNEETKKYVSPLFIPHDNSNNPNHEYEYGVMRKIYNQSWEEITHKGVISWKFQNKIRRLPTAKSFTNKIFYDKVMKYADSYDIITMNTWPGMEGRNVWRQGDTKHKNMLKNLDHWSKKVGKGQHWKNIIFTKKTLCYCNYFVANKKFWDIYMSYAEDFYPYAKLNNNFPYFMERILPSVLHDHQHELRIMPLAYPKPKTRKKIPSTGTTPKRVRLNKRKK